MEFVRARFGMQVGSFYVLDATGSEGIAGPFASLSDAQTERDRIAAHIVDYEGGLYVAQEVGGDLHERLASARKRGEIRGRIRSARAETVEPHPSAQSESADELQIFELRRVDNTSTARP